MDSPDLEPLCALVAGLPGWRESASRRALLADLAWELTDCALPGPGEDDGGPESAARLLVSLACAAREARGVREGAGEGPALRAGAAPDPVAGLIEDLRELGGDGAVPAAVAAELGLDRRRPRWTDVPYPGLFPFETGQAPIFFGRRAETRALLRRLCAPQAPRMLLLCGPPGTGKSSLVRAGAMARLAAGGLPRIPASERWLVSRMAPAGQGGDPFLALAHGLADAPGVPALDPAEEAARLKAYAGEALADLAERLLAARPPQARWVLVLDPLEELFLAVDPDLAEDLLDTLLAYPGIPRLVLLGVLRANQLDRCCRVAGLAQAVNAGAVQILPPPSRAALTRMILGPVTEVHLDRPMRIDPDLALRLAADTECRAGGLGPLADTLRTLYTAARTSRRMTVDAYEKAGAGDPGRAIARRAERALVGAGDEPDAALARLFPRLVAFAADGSAVRLRPEQAALARDPNLARALTALAGGRTRLVRIQPGARPTVQLAHETLLAEWPALRRWVERNREARQLRARLEDAARGWAAAGRSPDGRWPEEILGPARTLLAETGLLADLEADTGLGDFLVTEADWLWAELLCARLDPLEREEIGLRLAQIGDPRPGVCAPDGTPEIRWCDLPAGQVRVEGLGVMPVAPFRIAAYPVTQCQFEAFFDAPDGFASNAWWDGLGRAKPIAGRLRRRANYPVTHCSWFDAVAFCRWLSARLGLAVRLPDEWEWQWAAQSARSGFVYPWGREWRAGAANTDECGVGNVTAVGLFPAGQSLQGVCDLAGNVWEWCRNRFERPVGNRAVAKGALDLDPAARRVLRGGSWRVNQGFARADFRLDGLPDERMWGSGFRLVAAPQPTA